jgi:hypothetical protein
MSYSISSEPNEVVVVIPRRFNYLLFIFAPVWVVVCLPIIVRTARDAQPQSILTVTLFGLVTAFIVYEWLWNLGGKEELEFTASVLTHRARLFGICRSRVFSMKEIDNPHFENSRSRGKSRIPSGMGFSYKGKQLRFGDHLTQREAKEIVAVVLQNLPKVREYWGTFAEGLPELDEDMTLNLK